MNPSNGSQSLPKFTADLTARPVITGNDSISHVQRPYSVPGFVVYGNSLI